MADEPLVDSGNPSLTAAVIVPNKVITVFVDGVVSEVEACFSLRDEEVHSSLQPTSPPLCTSLHMLCRVESHSPGWSGLAPCT